MPAHAPFMLECGAQMMKRFLLVPECSQEQSSLASISNCDVSSSFKDQVVAEDVHDLLKVVRVQHNPISRLHPDTQFNVLCNVVQIQLACHLLLLLLLLAPSMLTVLLIQCCCKQGWLLGTWLTAQKDMKATIQEVLQYLTDGVIVPESGA